MEVIGSFIIGFDGEKPGADRRICAFMEQTGIPMAMLGVLQALPHTSLWNRLGREGRLRGEVEWDGGTFTEINYEPDRPEAEIMQEYVDAWDYLYEPSRYLTRAYRYFLAMKPTRRATPAAANPPLGMDQVPDMGMTMRRILIDIRAFFKILWWQGVLSSYRRQFWTQLMGMWRQNPTRLQMYLRTCAMAEDLSPMRKVVREKVTAIIKDYKIETAGV